MPHKHCLRLFILMIDMHMRGPLIQAWWFPGVSSPQLLSYSSLFSYICINDFTLIIDCLCNFIVFVRSFVHSFLPSFLPSFVRSFVRSFIRSFVYSV